MPSSSPSPFVFDSSFEDNDSSENSGVSFARTSRTAPSGSTPVIAQRTKTAIVDKVSTSRLTIIIGPTGSGKSTLVPPLLLNEFGGPILVTQPRRLAVVAVSSRVAHEFKTNLGGRQVGYHVGQHNLSTNQTQLLFTTAGILLEELRANGPKKAFGKFKCVLIDECHERSPESDLVICFIKTYLQQHPESTTRFLLMSATFDYHKYKQYFSQVCPSIDVISLETANAFSAAYNMVETLYLQDVVSRMLPRDKDNDLFLRKMKLHPHNDLEDIDGGKTLSNDILRIVSSLVSQLDKEEPRGAAFVIFAPTYRHLEQIYEALLYGTDSSSVKLWLNVLHSSVDIEERLRTMQETHDGSERKVLLASAIADSSVTIPGVTCVIDLCRSLRVKWDLEKQLHMAKTVWASHSICDQRRGRTGRTCPGRVFRLVTQGFYITQLQQWDTAQITLSSCREELLKVLCSNNNHSADPVMVLQRCLDPPPLMVLEDSIEHLKRIGACCEVEQTRSNHCRIIPTPYGKLMAALPFSVEDSKIILAGAQLGLLHETLAFRAICSHKPAPIVHHFGGDELNDECLRRYLPNVRPNDLMSVALANLSAYMLWDYEWNTKRSQSNRLEFQRLSESGHAEPDCGVWQWTDQLNQEHQEWCRARDINPTSVRAIAELTGSVREVLFSSKHEPEWLRCTDPTALWRRKEKWMGVYSGQCFLWQVYGNRNAPLLCSALLALSQSGGRVQSAVAEAQSVVGTYSNGPLPSTKRKERPPVACLHYLSGWCSFGDKCRHSHAPNAIRPPCKFYQEGRCNKGRDCKYSHEPASINITDPRNNGSSRGNLCTIAPLLQSLTLSSGALGWFERESPHLLLLGEGNFSFTRALTKLGCPPCVATTIQTSGHEPISSILYGVDATRLHMDTRIQVLLETGDVRSFSWNFPFTGDEEDASGNASLILGTLQSLSLMYADGPSVQSLVLGLALQGDQFSRWSVLKSAERAGWRLKAWSQFDRGVFPNYHPSRGNGERFPLQHPRFYVLECEPC